MESRERRPSSSPRTGVAMTNPPAQPLPPQPPSIVRLKQLQKQRSWSPEMDYEESWQRRKSLSRERRARRSSSVTDEDIEELRGFLDLGLVFGDGSSSGGGGDYGKRLSETLPALDLYLAVRRSCHESVIGRSSSASDSSSNASYASPIESPLSIFPISPGDSQEQKQAGIKRWARLVALAARDGY